VTLDHAPVGLRDHLDARATPLSDGRERDSRLQAAADERVPGRVRRRARGATALDVQAAGPNVSSRQAERLGGQAKTSHEADSDNQRITFAVKRVATRTRRPAVTARSGRTAQVVEDEEPGGEVHRQRFVLASSATDQSGSTAAAMLCEQE